MILFMQIEILSNIFNKKSELLVNGHLGAKNLQIYTAEID